MPHDAESNMARALLLALLGLSSCVSAFVCLPSTALAQKTIRMPPKGELSSEPATLMTGNEDLSAHRIDAEVFGWNKEYTELACIGLDVTRGIKGEHRGETFLLVFDIGSPVPKHNVHTLYITQVAIPDTPIPIEDVRNRMWGIDVSYQNTWPRRPRRKHFRGAMKIDPIWDFVDLGDGLCQPAVGFMLHWRGRQRYQPHARLQLKAGCKNLRYTDHRTYWAKKDLGAIMIRFDYSPREENEQSVRFPLSASWELGVPVTILLRSPERPAPGVKKELAELGHVEYERGGSGKSWRIAASPQMIFLAHRVAAKLGAQVTSDKELPKGVDILVEAHDNLTPKVPDEPPAHSASEPQPAVPDVTLPSEKCGGLLPHCDDD